VQTGRWAVGVPETFVIGGDGRILHQHIGDLRADDVADIMDRWKAAQ
jgi:cytochrome c biogenesis protein CcmG/thiol:disulfide interchange protein DsbE